MPGEISTTVVSAYERALILGDLAGLKQDERLAYYKAVCESVGLNPLTKPFDYITLNGKLTLYATRACADQLRKLHGVSVLDLHKEFHPDGILMITCKVSDKTGRTDVATGALVVQNLKGNDLANAMMKAETKAKRRATLSLCGLGVLDETEIETLPADVVPAFVPQATAAPAVNQAPCSLIPETPAPVVVEAKTVDQEACGFMTLEAPSAADLAKIESVPAPAVVTTVTQQTATPSAQPTPAPIAPATNPVSAKPSPAPAQVPTAAPAAVGDVPCDSKRYSVFVNERATKIIRDKLPKAGVKDAAVLVKNYLLKGAGKTSLPKISAVDFERLLSALEAGTPEEAAAIVTAK